MLRLENVVQPYAWGSVTAIPRLLGLPGTGAPQAELWLGAHPLAPSKVNGRSLEVVIADDPRAALGDQVVARFGERLPFLLKVLAAARPLSLQAHPSLAQARAGFEREESAGVPLTAPQRNYKDPNHKPELLCALTPFRALCGFRRAADSRALLSGLGVPALAPLLATLDARGLGAAFDHLMTTSAQDRGPLVASVAQACATSPVRGFEPECANAVALEREYPGDVGVIGALLLNLVTLKPGEALALGAGNLHAYLEGTGVELMANSDNVLRGGLTPKHVDVAELLGVLDFHDGPVTVVTPVGTPEAVYPTAFPDFRLSRVDVRGAVTLPRLGPDVLLCTAGVVTANRLELSRGGSVFAPFSDGPLELSGEGTLYRATVNAP
ncbi:MAG: mannose-6-phosphate isomerase, class I [Myxococcaceae bacterium]|nr:mannose-6-phosphate isomerase, class I [Myxococcaceae bacterium]